MPFASTLSPSPSNPVAQHRTHASRQARRSLGLYVEVEMFVLVTCMAGLHDNWQADFIDWPIFICYLDHDVLSLTLHHHSSFAVCLLKDPSCLARHALCVLRQPRLLGMLYEWHWLVASLALPSRVIHCVSSCVTFWQQRFGKRMGETGMAKAMCVHMFVSYWCMQRVISPECMCGCGSQAWCRLWVGKI